MTPDLHLVMHGTAIRKHGSAEGIAAVVGLPVARARAALDQALAGGRIAEFDGRYMLSAAGQMILRSEYSRFYPELRDDAVFNTACDRFEIINRELKQLITDWQTREIGGKRLANDHSDHAYDDRVIDRLGDLHERFEPIMQRLLVCLPRLSYYGERFAAALERAENGEIEWVSDAKIESYHTVWFELHEDLLRLRGRARDE
jgi:hypothetical protein